MLQFLNNTDQNALNDHAIASLAEQMQCDYLTVKRVYENEFCKLEAKARIRDYLVVLASRRTMDLIREQRVS